MGHWEQDFAAYVDGRAAALQGAAFLLCGDWHLAKDLTQTTLLKLYQSWNRIERRESVDAYARRVLVRTYLDEGRRPWRRERATAEVPDRPAGSAMDGDVAERVGLEAALRELPKTQRAVIVLRYWCDLDVRDTARLLGISEGTVKSATSRGLAALRVSADQLGSR